MFETMKEAASKLFVAGLNDSHSGNISIRNGDRIFITSKNAVTSDLKKEDIIEVSLDSPDDKDSEASRDLVIHRAIYKNTNALAVIHTHAPNAMALSLTENKILAQDAKGQSFFPQGVSIIKIRQGADKEEIARQSVPSLNQVPGAVVIKGYGCFVIAQDIISALEIATSLELSSSVWLKYKLLMPRQQPPQQPQHYERHKRSAIPPSIGVMGRRTGGYDRRDMKR